MFLEQSQAQQGETLQNTTASTQSAYHLADKLNRSISQEQHRRADKGNVIRGSALDGTCVGGPRVSGSLPSAQLHGESPTF